MADDQIQESPRTAAAATVKTGPGFFTIYKKGQGYWTRMGTAVSAALLCVLLAQFVYSQVSNIEVGREGEKPVFLSRSVAFGIGAGVFLALSWFCWRLMNKPSNVDFLVATDSEMKKVNWTTRKELIGSTKVVIFFVVLIALILFFLDIIFGYLFFAIRVLELPPL